MYNKGIWSSVQEDRPRANDLTLSVNTQLFEDVPTRLTCFGGWDGKLDPFRIVGDGGCLSAIPDTLQPTHAAHAAKIALQHLACLVTVNLTG